MSKEIVSHNNPEQNLILFVADISKQLTDVKTTVDEKKGLATVTGKKDGKILSMSIEQSEIGETRTMSTYSDLEKKSDYKDEVKNLRKKGIKQKDIALRLGISQSLVSKLSNE
ncbi:helix-turn-helix domain-containing protein [Paenibacillus nuruki]|uniref:helix-turn-helix domain-containing protein n=1 Tax=Paenibacillus nuruki TaxID=1886670 RepID=UPI00280539CB|nr:helix-turn-helix transcriptional regulator [Paenibacillus nuruki]CAJ1317315.1 hypothetical protein AASFL403_19105 [Paenibacillus nuruki]